MTEVPRHKAFISFHSEDKSYKDTLVELMEDDFIDQSVGDDDIDDSLSTDAIRQKIRDEFIRDATVTIVLIGECTWQRKHVDWEIGSSLRDTKKNSRCGLFGILLPTHPDSGTGKYYRNRIPPRVADNTSGDDPFAFIIEWCTDPDCLRQWIHKAFLRRDGTPPDNSRPQFKRNRSGDCSEGWSD